MSKTRAEVCEARVEYVSKMKDALVRIRDQSHESHWAGADQPMMSPDTGLPWVHWREIAREVLEEIEDE